jgi:hypothetical protein
MSSQFTTETFNREVIMKEGTVLVCCICVGWISVDLLAHCDDVDQIHSKQL